RVSGSPAGGPARAAPAPSGCRSTRLLGAERQPVASGAWTRRRVWCPKGVGRYQRHVLADGMKITQVLTAQAVRFVSVDTRRVYLPEVIKRLRERYGFVGVPSSVDEVLAPLDPNANRPLTFIH